MDLIDELLERDAGAVNSTIIGKLCSHVETRHKSPKGYFKLFTETESVDSKLFKDVKRCHMEI